MRVLLGSGWFFFHLYISDQRNKLQSSLLLLLFQLMNALKMGTVSNSRLAMAARFSVEREGKTQPIPVERSGGGV